jgi:ubiquinone/menaquinone biosynthesis C-methylase UbiE
MAPMMLPAAEAIAQILKPDLENRSAKVLDIAAGHGTFGITLARHNPKLQVVALDWAAVLAVARENAEKLGVAERFKTLPGSAFDVDYGTGYDAVLFTNFLHHFDHQENVKLLKKAHAALNPGGACLTLEFVPEPDRVTPPLPAMFSMIMLASTPKGDAYTFRELEAMHRDAGFGKCTLHPLAPLPQSVVLAHK